MNVRKVKEKRPDVEGMLCIPTPPMSKDCQLFPGLGSEGREVSTTGGTMAVGWFAKAATAVGDDSEAVCDLAEGEVVAAVSPFFAVPFGATGLIALGF